MSDATVRRRNSSQSLRGSCRPGAVNQATRIRPPQRDTCTFTPSRKLIYNLERHCHLAGRTRSLRRQSARFDTFPHPQFDTHQCPHERIPPPGKEKSISSLRPRAKIPACPHRLPGALSRWATNRSPHPASARELPGTFAKKLEDLVLHLRSFGPKLNQMTSSIDAMEYCSGNASGHHFGP